MKYRNTAVPEMLMDYIVSQKNSNESKYKIDDIAIREFVGDCWAMLSEAERQNYRNQLENPDIKASPPTVDKLAFDLNRGLQSAHDEASKNKSDIDTELKLQSDNFKYLNLSNSALEKDKGIFQGNLLEASLSANPTLVRHIGSIAVPLATFPSMEQLGRAELDKEKFVNATCSILEGMLQDQTKGKTILDERGILSANVSAAVAIYVDKNFDTVKDLTKEEQKKLGEDLKKEYLKLGKAPSLGKILDKFSNETKPQTLSVSDRIKNMFRRQGPTSAVAALAS